jgi:hypothetical protein
MYDSSFDWLGDALHNCEQRLAYWWHLHSEPEPRIANLQSEALQRLGQVRWCVKRIQEIERVDGSDNDFERDRSGSEALEIEILAEACYHFAARLLTLSPKVNTPGFPRRPPKLDVLITRNWLIEHADHPTFGDSGRHFMWQVAGGPQVKPFGTGAERPEQDGLYTHVAALLKWLKARLEYLETYQGRLT